MATFGLGNNYDVSVKFLADLESYIQGVEKGSRKIEQFGKRIQKVGMGLTKAITLPLIAMGAAAVNASLKMNTAMANVATLIPGATERVIELKKEIQDLSIVMGKSTADMAGGAYQIISAFGDTAETMALLEINANLAIAGLTSVTGAINLTSAVTKGYGDVSKEAMLHVSDLSMAVVRLGQTTLPELAAAIGGTVPLAAALNVKVEELFAGFATLTGVTGTASEVASQYEGMLSALIKPTEDMLKAIDNLGYASAEAMVAELGLVGAFQALIDNTDGSLLALGELIIRKEGLTAVLALTGAQADVFTQKLGDMGDVVDETAGAVGEQTEEINKAGFAWSQFKVKLQVMAERMGDELLPVFKKLIEEYIIPLIEKVVEWVKWFTNADESTKKVVLGIAAFLVVIGPAIIGIGKVITNLRVIKALLSGPTGIIALLALVATAIYAAYQANKKLNESYDETVKKVRLQTAELKVFKGESAEVTDKINKLREATDDSTESFDEARKATIELMDKYPGLRTEIGYTVDDNGDLYDANGDLVESFDALQGVVDEFSFEGYKRALKETTLTTYQELIKQADSWDKWWSFIWGGRKAHEERLQKLEDLGKLYAIKTDELVNELAAEEKRTRPEGAFWLPQPGDPGFIGPVNVGAKGEDEDKGKDRDREPSGTEADPVSVIIKNFPEYAPPQTAASFSDLYINANKPGRDTMPVEYAEITERAKEIQSELGYPWPAALYFASQDYTVQDLRDLGAVFPGDEGYEKVPPSEAALEAAAEAEANARKTSNIIKDMFMSIKDAILDAAKLLGKSIVSGDIAAALQNIFSMIGNAISEEVSAMVKSSIGGGGLFGSIAGAFTGGIVSGLFGLAGGLFGGGKDRGSDPTKPIFAFITNWDDYFQFGTTLPTSFVYSGRSGGYNVDPHGRAVAGWALGLYSDWAAGSHFDE